MASRNMSFLWYDYETSGRDPRRHRPVQFAGVRTDDALNELGEPLVWYCRPARDLLPEPGAVLVHGHAPSRLEEQGLSEAAFAEKIHEELSGPDVCAVGYNAIRFDHEHTRFLFYRNLLDPYAWHWKNGNTRWDVIDLFRAAYALRPEGIQWPLRKDARNGNEGRPSFRLQDLAAANNIGGHGVPHEALADVRTMIELVRLVRDRQPKLFDWALRIRDKRVVAAVMRGENPHSDQKPIEKEDCFVWVASLFQRQGCASPVFRMASHPDYSDAEIVFDLSQDPSELAGLSAEALRDRLFRPGSRSSVFVVKANRCPFVAPYSLLTDEVLGRMGLDRDTLEERYRMLSGTCRTARRCGSGVCASAGARSGSAGRGRGPVRKIHIGQGPGYAFAFAGRIAISVQRGQRITRQGPGYACPFAGKGLDVGRRSRQTVRRRQTQEVGVPVSRPEFFPAAPSRGSEGLARPLPQTPPDSGRGRSYGAGRLAGGNRRVAQGACRRPRQDGVARRSGRIRAAAGGLAGRAGRACSTGWPIRMNAPHWASWF